RATRLHAERKGDGPLSGPSQLGGLATGVPGEPLGIATLLQRFGRLPRAQVVAPALRYAQNGAAASTYLAGLVRHFASQLARDPALAAWFLPQGTAAVPGQRLRNRALAKTLQRFAAQGAHTFYRGAMARGIIAANRKAGGVLRMRDLHLYQVRERPVLQATRRGLTWATAPPPSAGGYILLSSLALRSHWWPDQGPVPTWLRLHGLAESWKGPFWDRRMYFGDPDFVTVPLKALMAPARVAARAALFHPTLALPQSWYALPLPDRPAQAPTVPENPGTSHLCAVDADGNVAAVTTSINLPFGARYSAHGYPLNDHMDDFSRTDNSSNAFGLVGGENNRLAPRKRPVSSMAPTLVLDAQGPVLCIGASGGSRIITAIAQVADQVLRRGKTPAEALALPRIHHQGQALTTHVKSPLPARVLAALKARGHVHKELDSAYRPAVQLIQIRREGKRRLLYAAADASKGGIPAGR
ncbi:MAG: gamma-glutamyltransferase family protein, partial [Polyangiales bacterium]